MDFFSQPIQIFIEQMILFVPKLIVALLVFAASMVVSGLSARGVSRALQIRQVDPELSLLLVRLTRWTVIGAGTIMGLQQVDFDLTGFLAGLGIVGFTIGFAVQDVSKNFIAGALLLLQQPFDIGDSISVSGYQGTVTDIRLRDTEMRTFDGLQISIPNGDVYVSAITNFTRVTRRRIALEVGVGYESDLETVSDVLTAALRTVPGVLTDDPAPAVVFKSFGDSSVDLTAYYWFDVQQAGYFGALDCGVKAIKKACEEAGINIPYPVQTVLLPGHEA
ncbi:MAG: mechanosensitive ion channel family protein [Anaerolineales bacterium]